MPSIGLNPENFLAELDQLSVEEVRIRLATKVYNENVGEKGAIAREWLMRKDQELAEAAAARNSATQAKQLEAASLAATAALRAADASERSAEAAERQASTAERAARTAIAALIVAIIAAIFSLVALFRSS